jgi:hypothetical protein
MAFPRPLQLHGVMADARAAGDSPPGVSAVALSRLGSFDFRPRFTARARFIHTLEPSTGGVLCMEQQL